MAFDGVFLSLIKKEIEAAALLSRVDKVYQPSKEEIVLCLRGFSSEKRLLISARPSAARLQFTSLSIENPPSPPMFCMLMRKHLVGARLSGLRQPGSERLLILDFDTRNELGDEVTVSIACEIMGRNANIVLIGHDGRVIDAVRRTDASNTVRVMMPGIPYTPPPAQDKLDFFHASPEDISERVSCSALRELDRAIGETVSGLSPSVCRSLAAGIESDPYNMKDGDKTALSERLYCLKQAVSDGGTPTLLVGESGPVDFSFTALFTPHGFEIVRHDSYSELLDSYYGEKEKRERMRSKSSELSKLISNLLSRTRRRVAGQEKELEATADRERYRISGELIKANIHSIQPGDTVCRAINYYSEDFSTVDIRLDPALSPAQNAQRYFKDYRKANTARQMLGGLIEKGRTEARYLESVLHEIEKAECDADLAEIREELISAGYVKRQRSGGKQPKRNTAGAPAEYISSDGFRIAAGRNNRQNDELTLKTASGRDMWFHVKNIPGSHVIVFAEGEELPDSTLEEAAIIAAANSKAADGVTVAVDYLPAKRVKKPNGAPPGMVIYENYSTAFVTADRTAAQRLRKKVR